MLVSIEHEDLLLGVLNLLILPVRYSHAPPGAVPRSTPAYRADALQSLDGGAYRPLGLSSCLLAHRREVDRGKLRDRCIVITGNRYRVRNS